MKKKIVYLGLLLSIILILSSLVIKKVIDKQESEFTEQYNYYDIYNIDKLENVKDTAFRTSLKFINDYCLKEKEFSYDSKNYILLNCQKSHYSISNDNDYKVVIASELNYNSIQKYYVLGEVKKIEDAAQKTYLSEYKQINYYFDITESNNFDYKIVADLITKGVGLLIVTIIYMLVHFVKKKKIAYYFESHKWTKVVFIISFLPYIFILCCGIFGAITGVTFITSTSYGLDAFFVAIFISGFYLLVIIPIIPICIIYDVIYLICKHVTKKEKTKK